VCVYGEGRKVGDPKKKSLVVQEKGKGMGGKGSAKKKVVLLPKLRTVKLLKKIWHRERCRGFLWEQPNIQGAKSGYEKDGVGCPGGLFMSNSLEQRFKKKFGGKTGKYSLEHTRECSEGG